MRCANCSTVADGYYILNAFFCTACYPAIIDEAVTIDAKEAVV